MNIYYKDEYEYELRELSDKNGTRQPITNKLPVWTKINIMIIEGRDEK